MEDWIASLFAVPALTRWGHDQRVADRNLGLGWVYYALARVVRPKTAVVIGSYRGFVPLVLGKALQDNGEGEVVFIDPSLVDDFWKDAGAVKAHFVGFGVGNVRHFLMTTQEFAASDSYRQLGEIGLVFIDGYHSAEQARFDYKSFIHLLAPDGVILLHDTARISSTSIYGPDKVYERRVKVFTDALKLDPELQVFDLPFDEGVTLVRKASSRHRPRADKGKSAVWAAGG
jgi:predicted O-methyltransferase YrrM